MTSFPRIGLLTPGWPGQKTPNGIATAVYHLASGMRDIGAPPVILARALDGEGPAELPVIEVADIKWLLRDRVRATLGDTDAWCRIIARAIARSVNKAIKLHGLDVVIMEETNGLAAFVQRRVDIPVIVALHGPWGLQISAGNFAATKADRQRERRESRAFVSASGLISPTRFVLDAVAGAVDLKDQLTAVVPNALPAREIAAHDTGEPADDILFVGRFDEVKGGDTVLAAFAALSETHPDAKLTFVGNDMGIRQADGTVLKLEAAIEALGEPVKSRIECLGPQSKESVARLRARHRLALVASRFETFGYTVLEAMRAGQAIVCTQAGGPSELLVDGNTALMVPPNDPVAMARALGRLIDDKALASRLGAAAQSEVSSRYDPVHVAHQTIAFAKTVLEKHP